MAEGEATTEERESGGAEAPSPSGREAPFIAGDPPATAPPPKTDRLAALAAKPKPWLQRAAEVRSGGPIMRSIGNSMETPPANPTPSEPPADAPATRVVEAEEATPAPAPPRPVYTVESPTPTGAAPAPIPAAPVTGDLSKLEEVCQQILEELRNRDEPAVGDFSVSKLLAGIVQVLSLAALFYAYLRHARSESPVETMLLAIALQTLTISLLIMGRQK